LSGGAAAVPAGAAWLLLLLFLFSLLLPLIVAMVRMLLCDSSDGARGISIKRVCILDIVL